MISIVHDPVATTAITDGKVIYAIGDVHGCADSLSHLLDIIKPFYMRDLNNALDTSLVFLGDYTDRGPNSAKVIDIVMNTGLRDARLTQINLVGNHCILLHLFLNKNDIAAGRVWEYDGGSALIKEARGDVKKYLGEDRLRWISELQNHFQAGNALFVHAGISSDLKNDQLKTFMQEPWCAMPRYAFIRNEFLRYKRRVINPELVIDTHFVIHGHTISPPSIHDYRIGIDTGCYKTGVLTAVRIFDGSATFFQSHKSNPDKTMIRLTVW
jgi:serine/threonine protein phosphatase 1